MRVMVALENRFVKTQNGNIYSTTVCDYNFWSRYLLTFDEVVVFARVKDSDLKELDKVHANGLNVRFFPLPYYVGPWQYVKQHRKLVAQAKQAVYEADAFILRIPGRISTLLWHQLMRKKIPYGVEVVGSSSDSAKTSGANILLRGIYRLMRKQKEQCKNASAATYITKNYLQSLYPPGGWSISCSDVDLPGEAITEEHQLSERLASLKDAISGRRSFRICHAGTMSALYKAQDVLIEAICICRNRGLDIELTLLGDGKYRQDFEEKARKLRIAEYICFAGFLPPGAAVREQLDRADLFVFPSLTEGQGRVLIEAMARGLPCIASNVGGIPELLDAGDLVPPKDAKALAAKIEIVVNDIGRLERMARRNLEKAKEYHIDKLNQWRLEFYKKVAELSKAGTSSNKQQ